MSNFLSVGDVFALLEEMKIYISLPKKFIYSNVFNGDPGADDLSTTDIRVGSILKAQPNMLTVKKPAFFDSASLCGEYIVTKTNTQGGGYGHGNMDYYPNGWHITAVKLKDGAYDPDGQVITFYQSGAFTAMNEDVPVLRTLKQNFS